MNEIAQKKPKMEWSKQGDETVPISVEMTKYANAITNNDNKMPKHTDHQCYQKKENKNWKWSKTCGKQKIKNKTKYQPQ